MCQVGVDRVSFHHFVLQSGSIALGLGFMLPCHRSQMGFVFVTQRCETVLVIATQGRDLTVLLLHLSKMVYPHMDDEGVGLLFFIGRQAVPPLEQHGPAQR